jgi:hypothetical protein
MNPSAMICCSVRACTGAYDIVYAIEAEQIERGIGMTTVGRHGSQEDIFKEVEKKVFPTTRLSESSNQT